jgi:hypothetical protein
MTDARRRVHRLKQRAVYRIVLRYRLIDDIEHLTGGARVLFPPIYAVK